MAFIKEEIPKVDLHRYRGFWYLDNGGRPMGRYSWKAIDYDRKTFLVISGPAPTGTEPGPDRYVLKIDNLYIDFQGMFSRDEVSKEYSLEIWSLHIPMNLAPRTMEIINIIKEALPILHIDSKGKPDDSKLIFAPPAYTPAAWCLDSVRGLILTCFGKNIKGLVHSERFYEAWYAFSQGERNPDTLYNFRLWYGDWPVDFQACFRLGDNGPVWEIIEAAVPEDLEEHTAALVAEIPGALSKFSAIAEASNPAAVDANQMRVVTGPAIAQEEKTWGAKFYASKYWAQIPVERRASEYFAPGLQQYFQPEIAND